MNGWVIAAIAVWSVALALTVVAYVFGGVLADWLERKP